MEENNITLILIAIIGFLQIALGILAGRRNNEAVAKRDKADAAESIGASYSSLVIRLEARITTLEKEYNELRKEYDEEKRKWHEERQELQDLILGLQNS